MGTAAERRSPWPCRASSGTAADLINRSAPAPYRWSWQDDGEPAPALELDTAAVEATESITGLTSTLRAAADAAPPRACLTPAARALLNRAVQRLLPCSAQSPGPVQGQGSAGSAASSDCTVAQAAALLEAYGKATQGQRAAAGSGEGTAATGAPEEAAPPLVATLLALVCGLSGGSGSCGSDSRAAVETAPARALADLLWALSELEEDLPWDERPAGSGASGAGSGASGSAATTAPVATAPAASEASQAGSSGRTAESDTWGAVAAAAPAALQRAVLARVRDQDFLAPDLCRAVCALGSLAASGSPWSSLTSGIASVSALDAAVSGSAGPESGTGSASAASASGRDAAAASAPSSSAQGARSSVAGRSAGFRLDPELMKALSEEIRFQLSEFDADFSAEDLARLISGMAGLRLGAAVAGDEEYRRIMMKAVYGKTRSISEKAAVDFALSRLMTDDPEARSMHYDSRWTHEELRWLPRRERDKRRIIKENWYRTQWGGWAPGSGHSS